ncbi:uncharacterized protein N7483_009018 [Penicillium malachiteum]|uniref:uncharacterized protein n=1 Tax=Penicillium malachiteum TaxID=1324776 RepID=UPI0025467BBA|nr:uncharacterized protein N7483_009018 [Penicillium malachiteum]KAJ5721084.1 hypothetical protein N7483_009018 [Penicillium malachiteum]
MSNQGRPTDPAGEQGASTRDNQREHASSGETSRNSTSNASLDRDDREIIYFNSLLQKLLDLIAHGDEASVARVISTIRSGASHDQILEMIDQFSNSGSTNGASNGTRSRE